MKRQAQSVEASVTIVKQSGVPPGATSSAPPSTCTCTMGCGESKLHPRNAELAKFKKKYDTTQIRDAQPVHIWVIGAVDESARELGYMVAAKHGYVCLSEKALLEAEAASASERGQIVKAILEDKGLVSLSIVEDLITEALISKSQVSALKGVVFSDLPRCKCQAKMLKKIVGSVSLIIYMKWPEGALKAALHLENDEKAFTKRMEEFNKHVLPLATHKKAFMVDGEAGAAACLSACADTLNRVVIAGC